MTDVAGARFGRLTLVSRVEAKGKPKWLCKCDCGKQVTRKLQALRERIKDGGTSSCGCYQSEINAATSSARFDPTPYMQKRFGRLLVTGVSVDPTRAQRQKSRLVCLCDCGAQAVVVPMQLTSGKTTSCGCYHKERLSEVAKQTATIHAQTVTGVLNGHTPIYRAWLKIRAGCVEGWRAGFHKVCHEYDPRWDEFDAFYQDFGAIKITETISRKDNQAPWSKNNCFVNIGRRAKSAATQPKATP
jgi:hypothetical protein